MRGLHGVLYSVTPQDILKRQAVLFDKFRVVDLRSRLVPNPKAPTSEEWDFLESRGIAEMVPAALMKAGPKELKILPGQGHSIAEIWDAYVRYVAAYYSDPECDVVGICREPLPSLLPCHFADDFEQTSSVEKTLRVALHQLPTPSETCAWQDIIEFKATLLDKQWSFRRFLATLGAKKQSESEIRDDIEWTLNEYRKAMKIHHIKSRQSFVDVFVVAPLELIEDLVRFKWSKIAKGLLSVKKREVELLEAEMKAPGNECAYLFAAREKFGES
jgi:hypothetical protein